MKIGLTGSIACGKSTVSGYLRTLGYPVVDADAISRAMTAPGGQALPAIRELTDADAGDVPEISCAFWEGNRECRRKSCPFWPGNREADK